VEWYLFSINPFLDYQFTFPGGYNILMLDWAQKENVVFYNSQNGQQYGFALSPDEGPKASNCLTSNQKELVERFTATPGAAKIIGIHAPPIGPWPDWYDNELLCGWNEHEEGGGRGYQLYRATLKCNGKTESVRGHPFFAIRPKHNFKDAVYGMDAIYGSFENNRDWFIRRLADPKYSVRVVLSGHIHRQGFFVTEKLKNPDTALKDELLIRSINELVLNGQEKPASVSVGPRPLYVNTTSLGPRGHFYRSSEDKDKGPPTNPNPRYTDDISVPPGITIIEINNRGVLQKIYSRRL